MDVSPSVCEVAEESDYELLTKLVPQACHDSPFLRSAMLCITSYYLSLADPVQREQHCMAAEYQYTKIIKSMVSSQLGSQHWTATIMLCLLLIVIEAHRNDHKRALTHLQAAISIYQEKQSSTDGLLMDGTLRRVSERFQDRLLFATGKLSDTKPVCNQPNTAFFYRGLYDTASRPFCETPIPN